jgi:hypothetical protein
MSDHESRAVPFFIETSDKGNLIEVFSNACVQGTLGERVPFSSADRQVRETVCSHETICWGTDSYGTAVHLYYKDGELVGLVIDQKGK